MESQVLKPEIYSIGHSIGLSKVYLRRVEQKRECVAKNSDEMSFLAWIGVFKMQFESEMGVATFR